MKHSSFIIRLKGHHDKIDKGGVSIKTILVTGGAGFIGSHYVRLLSDKHPDYRIINADALTYAANQKNIAEAALNPKYTFIRVDIRDRAAIDEIFLNYGIDTVVNFAAQSHVDRSIDEPEAFLTTNILGTQVLLDAAVRHWKLSPEDRYDRRFLPGVRFLQISTDEVYGASDGNGSFTEDSPLLPNNPYAASKAGADMFVRAYHKTYGLPVNITRSCNNYGSFQHPEKLIPLIITNCINNESLPVYGAGEQLRDWLHVEDNCTAIDAVLHKGEVGEVYNISAYNERTNIDVVRRIVDMLGKSEKLLTYVKDRPGHDWRYAMDSTKIRRTLGWEPKITFENGLRETVEWYLKTT